MISFLRSRQQIRNALRNNEFLKNLDAVQLQEIVSCMYEHSIVEGCYIIREGEDGQHLYVAAGASLSGLRPPSSCLRFWFFYSVKFLISSGQFLICVISPIYPV